MTVALVFALEAESAPWRARHRCQSIGGGSQRVVHTTLGRVHVRAVTAGVGAASFPRVVEVLCEGGVDVMLTVGLAGALRAPHLVGDIVVARQLLSDVSGTSIAATDWLVDLASQCGATPIDVMVTSDRVAGRVEDKQRLSVRGEAVDMESFHVVQEATRRGIASAAIRVIGDEADEDLPLDFNRVIRPDGSVSRVRVIGEIARNPARWRALAAFGRRQQAALRSLVSVLDRVIDRAGSYEHFRAESGILPPGQPVLQRTERA